MRGSRPGTLLSSGRWGTCTYIVAVIPGRLGRTATILRIYIGRSKVVTLIVGLGWPQTVHGAPRSG